MTEQPTPQTEQIEACPYCESTDLLTNGDCVLCRDCGLHGPFETIHKTGVQLWNEVAHFHSVVASNLKVLNEAICEDSKDALEGWGTNMILSAAAIIRRLRSERDTARREAIEECANICEREVSGWATDGDLLRGYRNRGENIVQRMRSLAGAGNTNEQSK